MSDESKRGAGEPFAEAHGSATEIIEDLVRACGSGMNWMEQVSRAKLGSATRGILTTDMGMCSNAMFKARLYLEKVKSPN
jgi:hypothetical protein